jgi:hypothetical protein
MVLCDSGVLQLAAVLSQSINNVALLLLKRLEVSTGVVHNLHSGELCDKLQHQDQNFNIKPLASRENFTFAGTSFCE